MKKRSEPYFDHAPLQAWVALGVVSALGVVNYLDRTILGAVLPQIKLEFALTDTQLGLLSIGFSVFYAALGVFFGRLTDLFNRQVIMAVSGILWSVFTGLCGLATSFWMLFAARMGVAIGEGGYMPAAYSTVSDYFPPVRRNFVFGLLSVATSLGTVLGISLGGTLAELYGWRVAFFVPVLPGLLVSFAIIMVVREPARDSFDTHPTGTGPALSFRATLETLWKNPIVMWLVTCAGLNGFAFLGIAQWLPSYFSRSFNLPLSTIGIAFGISFGVGLAAGQFVGAILAQRAAKQRIFKSIYLCIIANGGVVPLFLAVLWIPNPYLAIALTLAATFVGTLGHSAQGAGTQNAITSSTRGVAHSLHMISVSVIGMGIGPLVVGALSDVFAPMAGEDSLRWALSVAQILMLLGVFAAWRAYEAGRIRDEGPSTKGESTAPAVIS